MVTFVNRFQGRKREANGGNMAVVTLGCRSLMSIYCEIGGINGVSGSAPARKEEGEQEEGKVSPELAGIGDAHCQYLRPSERNFDGLAAQFEKKKRERKGFYGEGFSCSRG
jgi:hypothetical protein